MAVLQWTVRAVQLQSALSPVETALQTLHQPSRLLHANCGPAIANCGARELIAAVGGWERDMAPSTAFHVGEE